MAISDTSSIEEYIADLEKGEAERSKLDKAKADKSGDDKPDYDWSTTEDMKQYYNSTFKRYQASKGGLSLGAALAAMGDLFEEGKAWLRRKFG